MFNPTLYLPDFSVVRGVSVFSGGIAQLVGSDPNRVYLAARNTNGQICYVSDDGGFTPPIAPWSIATDATLEFFWERHGLLVTLPLYFTSKSPLPVGGVKVAWWAMQFNP